MFVKNKEHVINDFIPYAMNYKEKIELNPYNTLDTSKPETFYQTFESPEALAVQKARNEMSSYLKTLENEDLKYLYVMMYIGRDETLKPGETIDELYNEMVDYLPGQNSDGMIHQLSSKGSNVIDYLLEAKNMI